MIVQFRNEKVSIHGSIPITIDCNVVSFIVFEEEFHQPIKRTKQSVFLDVMVFRHTLVVSFTPNAAVLFVDVAIQPEVRFIAKQNSLMKIGNNGNLVLGPFDESTPCLMIVLMNCQTKPRINHLTAVESVAILERFYGKCQSGTLETFKDAMKQRGVRKLGAELSVAPQVISRHLVAIEMVKKLETWVPYALMEEQRLRHLDTCKSLQERERGQTINTDVYRHQLNECHRKLPIKQLTLVNGSGPILLLDEARPHASVGSQQKIQELEYELPPVKGTYNLQK
ncbi:adhesion G protein-coupled receptor B2 [Trichonephila clavipes]|nr:adhesion G protein-coupled receptor B2 [Trichonephila clavipes]